MGYNEIDTKGGSWKPTFVGQKLEGVLKSRTVQKGSNDRDYTQFHVIEEETDQEYLLWGAVLESKLAEVPDGSKILVTFAGEGRSKKGNPFPNYTVAVWSDEDKPEL
jgi:hypothetical protein